MSSQKTDKSSLHMTTIIIGVTTVIMAILAGFAVGVVDNQLIDYSDSIATANNIKNSIALFKAGIFSWLMILICDIVISWALYIYLKPIHSRLSLLKHGFA